MRAFSLIEVAVCVAILGVVAALAIPNLLPLVHFAQIDGATDGAANFIARVRAEAMLSKRCVRVRISGAGLVGERLNTFDCEPATPTGPFIDNTVAAPFLVFDRFTAESPNVTMAFTTLPAAPGGEVRFRPSGRVFSNDVTGSPITPILTNDDAVLELTHAKLPGVDGKRRILVEENGLVCTFLRGETPPGSAPNFNCP